MTKSAGGPQLSQQKLIYILLSNLFVPSVRDIFMKGQNTHLSTNKSNTIERYKNLIYYQEVF